MTWVQQYNLILHVVQILKQKYPDRDAMLICLKDVNKENQMWRMVKSFSKYAIGTVKGEQFSPTDAGGRPTQAVAGPTRESKFI